MSSLQELIRAGKLKAGDTLVMRRRRLGDVVAVVSEDGGLRIGSQHFATPSGAAKFVVQRPINGWDVWKDAMGNSLAHLRDNLND